jgi:protein-tyrosine phosphatase
MNRVSPRLIARLVPAAARRHLLAVRALRTRAERHWYVRLLLRHSVLRRPFIWTPPEYPITSVLFVCYGNIMRSPFAEAALRREAEAAGLQVTVASAGTNAGKGRPADPRTMSSAERQGLSLDTHRSRLLDRQLVKDADLIVTMDYLNAASVLGRFPDAVDRTLLLGAFGGDEREPLEIGDPYDTAPEIANACFGRILRCVRALAAALGASGASGSGGSAHAR